MLRNKGQFAVHVVLFARASTLPRAAVDRYSISAPLTEMLERCVRKSWTNVA